MQPNEDEVKINDTDLDNNKPQDFKPLGDFDVRRVKRKSKFDKKGILIIGGMVTITVILIGSIIAVAWSKISENHVGVDETKVQADPALNAKKIKDEDMDKMLAQLNSPEKEADTGKASQSNNQTYNSKNKQQTQPETNQDVPPEVRKEETLFGSVNRFDTGGFSAGSVGGDSGSAQSPASQSGSMANGASNDGNDNLRALASAPLNGTQTSSGGGLLAAGGGGSGGELDNLTGSQYATARAYRAPPPKYLLKRRTTFQCALYTGVKTDHPGFVSCQLTRPIYSADGSTVLAEEGAELYGEQKVEVKAGQSSVFTTWTDLDTYPGVRAQLNGLGTDSLGQSGTEAYINNHYGQKFGGAVMLSFIQDALANVANRSQPSSGQGGYTVNNSEQNAEDMASKALENSINIPPTGFVLPGTVINVIVAQDIDFSSVFTTR